MLLVEDDASSRAALAALLEIEGFEVRAAGSVSEAWNLAELRAPELVLTDIVLPDGTGIDLMRRLKERIQVDVLVTTGHASVSSAVEALRQGAIDYVVKPLDFTYLKRRLAQMRRTALLRREIGTLRVELRNFGRCGTMVGSAPSMQRVYDLMHRVGPTEASVLLTGETGSGKDVTARTLHDLSERRDQPFVAMNCGAVPANMIESELFGHERSSFTGASHRHTGYFERATGGTLFLDEITETSRDLQVRLLRVVESRSLLRIGGEKEIPVDVRIIAATNRSPALAIAEGKLREDLYYRLRVVEIHLPALRDRGDDVLLLAEHFLALLNQESGIAKRFTPAARRLIGAHAWPGNVRELKNVVQAAHIMGGTEIGPEDLNVGEVPALAIEKESAAPAPPAADGSHVVLPVGTTRAEAERRLFLLTLEHCAGNRNLAARMLGVSQKTMYNRLKLYDRETTTGA